MTTARALLLSALLVAITIAGAAWYVTTQGSGGERYELVNVGKGVALRLDRKTGDLMRCEPGGCFKAVEGNKVMTVKDQASAAAPPPPPPGYKIDEPLPPPDYNIDSPGRAPTK